ncbi:NADH dehydrogenase subunit 5 (mitochondrion) [Macrobrachium nipponense]|uniref:NADH-ubiquinone oxidoreductase chain 5 n=2 Tax=Macrobrachium nipponense TaxID=159736 RepID=E7EL58_MACNP|nr:NADH dehydrogenase subunit 5 [Macrobrachium nipponense]ADV30209.1 NADH dehydrogenase subunit 5 [Macrobrachium nipponense]
MNLSSMVFLLLVSICSLITSLNLLSSGCCYFMDWELISINSASVEMALIIDWMSMMFMSFVCFISSMVLFYSGGYMSGDYNIGRFMYLVLGFVLSMLLLIISPNMISILLGWDGLGLVSYALVIYYQNEKSAGAGMLTALSNRVGDVAILLSISLMLSLGGWNFYFYVGEESLNSSYVVFLVVLAAMTKSAQIPFSAWLPAAMAAPTPVSALVHSSTLVTAGVYLLIRFHSSLMTSFASTLLLLLGCLTMFMAGLGANFETDLKKIIALSTLSQLGVMITILSLGWATLAFFHLLTHALFKALLFMCAGSIIHSVGDYQDIRMMGGLVNFMPISVVCINLANLALCGFPFLAGFYSKDLILEVAFLNPLNEICFWLLALATGLTVCYSFRLVYYSLSGDYNLSSVSFVSDSETLMTWPMLGLSIGAVVGGSAVSWLVFPSPTMICLTLSMKLLALVVSLVGGFIGYVLNLMVENYKLNSLQFYPVVVFSGSMWFMPLLSTIGISRGVLAGGFVYTQLGDGGWSEYYGGQGIYSTLMKSSGYLQAIQENSIKTYLIILLIWLVGLLLII